MTKPGMTSDTEMMAGYPEEIDEEGLMELLDSLPEDILLTLLMDLGLAEEGDEDG